MFGQIGRWISFGILLLTGVIVVLAWGWRTLNRNQVVPQPSLPDNQSPSAVIPEAEGAAA